MKSILALLLATSVNLVAELLPSLTAEQLMPTLGPNSVRVDDNFRFNLESLLGGLVEVNPAAASGIAQAFRQGNFCKDKVHITRDTKEDWKVFQLFNKEQLIEANYLAFVSGKMAKNDKAEVKAGPVVSLHLNIDDLDSRKLEADLKGKSAAKLAGLGVITDVIHWTVEQGVYSEKEVSGSAGVYGVKIGGKWYYRTTDQRRDAYVIVIFEPLDLYLKRLANNSPLRKQGLNTAKFKDIDKVRETLDLDVKRILERVHSESISRSAEQCNVVKRDRPDH